MILDQFLNESYNPTVGVVEPLFESYIQGEDANEICMMTEDFNRDIERLDEGVMLAESLAFVCEQKGEYEKAAVLQENAVTDFFKKLKDMIVKLWQKVKAFFVNLFKSIDVAMRDVNKSLSGVDKYLNKDFSNFSYDGHKWAANPSIQNTLGTQAIAKINARKKMIEGIAKNAESACTKVVAGSVDMPELKDDHSKSVREAIGAMVGGSGEKTLEQAKDVIKEHWGYTTSTDSIKNFSVASKEKMIQFLKDFNKNKVLTDLKKESDDAFKEAVDAISEAQKKAEGLKPREDVEGKSLTNVQSTLKNAVTNIKSVSGEVSQIVSAYDKLMGECIACEKAKFSEYRRAISAAIRYKAKEK